jgi:uncharacterized protein (DUF2336 family)
LAPPLRTEAALAMMALLDDPAIVVRQALAEALCRARDAPRAVILALAADDPEAAAPVIQYSPVLTDADLVACATNGDLAARMALARRPNLARQAAATLAETGEHDAVLSLIGNLDVDLPAELLGRILTRFNDDASVRDALLARAALPANLRARIAVAAAKDLSIEASLWMAPERAEHLAREARDQAICSIASSCGKDERAELARALRTAGALTPALLLRSLLGGERTLFAAAMAELSGLPLSRVAGFMLKPRAQGFAALARRAGVKKSLMPAFCAALEVSKTYLGTVGEGLKLSLVQKVIEECERRDDPRLTKALALLWRFAAEAARIEAASFAHEASISASAGRLPRILNFSPVNDDGQSSISIADFTRPSTRATMLELNAPSAQLSEDRTPGVELPPVLVNRLADAA